MSITDWSYSKYIVGTSLLFQIPSYYAYLNHQYYISMSLFITSLLSINFWRDCKYSWRRTMDIWWARIVGGFYFCYSIYYIPKITIVNTIIMLWFYYQANKKYDIDPFGKWYIYHMIFHIISVINQCIFIYIKTEYPDSLVYNDPGTISLPARTGCLPFLTALVTWVAPLC